MQRLIVGCGYLGLRVAQRWVAQGDQVLALTRSESRISQLAELGVTAIVGDVTQPETLVVPPVDTVLHAVGYDRSAAPSKREVYVGGLANLLAAIGGRCGRFLHVSSTSVYAQQNGEIIDEQSPCEPSDESGCICRDAEQLVTGAGSQMPFNILRLSGIYGPNRLLSRIDMLKTGQLLPGLPDAWLNLVHVDDAAAAVVACADRGQPGATYLVSDDQPILRREYYGLLARLVGAGEPRFDVDAVARHMRGINKRCNNRKLREELQVELQFPTIDSGLPAAIGAEE